jgi:hypothetical protein
VETTGTTGENNIWGARANQPVQISLVKWEKSELSSARVKKQSCFHKVVSNHTQCSRGYWDDVETIGTTGENNIWGARANQPVHIIQIMIN